MKIERALIPESTLEDFADQHQLVMAVAERSNTYTNDPMRFSAAFKRCEVQDGGILAGVHGNGATEPAAIADYARKISEQRLVVNAMGSDRRVIQAPRFIQRHMVVDLSRASCDS